MKVVVNEKKLESCCLPFLFLTLPKNRSCLTKMHYRRTWPRRAKWTPSLYMNILFSDITSSREDSIKEESGPVFFVPFPFGVAKESVHCNVKVESKRRAIFLSWTQLHLELASLPRERLWSMCYTLFYSYKMAKHSTHSIDQCFCTNRQPFTSCKNICMQLFMANSENQALELGATMKYIDSNQNQLYSPSPDR